MLAHLLDVLPAFLVSRAVIGGAGHVWGALVGAGVITLLKQWLQDILPKVFGSAGNFEVIIFGVMMVIVLQRARDGLWPLIAGATRRFIQPAIPEGGNQRYD